MFQVVFNLLGFHKTDMLGFHKRIEGDSFHKEDMDFATFCHSTFHDIWAQEIIHFLFDSGIRVIVNAN